MLLAELASLQAQAGAGSTTPMITPSSTYSFSRNLQLYDVGSDVTALQTYLIQQNKGAAAQKLKAHGVTQTFGSLTFNALVEFQKVAGITPTSGFFGPITRGWVSGHQ